MIAPDFSRYSLALIDNERVVYSSCDAGLQPLVDCIHACQGRYRDCVLHDRVFGLAAARLASPTGLIKSVVTRAVSRPALTFLEAHQIAVTADEVVVGILTRDRSAVCPGEIIALQTGPYGLFRERIMAMLGE
jgi:hypothetical protein